MPRSLRIRDVRRGSGPVSPAPAAPQLRIPGYGEGRGQRIRTPALQVQRMRPRMQLPHRNRARVRQEGPAHLGRLHQPHEVRHALGGHSRELRRIGVQGGRVGPPVRRGDGSSRQVRGPGVPPHPMDDPRAAARRRCGGPRHLPDPRAVPVDGKRGGRARLGDIGNRWGPGMRSRISRAHLLLPRVAKTPGANRDDQCKIADCLDDLLAHINDEKAVSTRF